MSEKLLTESAAQALSGATDSRSGLVYPALLTANWWLAMYRAIRRLLEVGQVAGELRVYEVEGVADAVGVRPGRRWLGSEALVYAGEDPAVEDLADNDVTYIWAQRASAGVLEIGAAVDGTGWPAGPHWRLAEVTMADGAITGMVDRRGELVTGVVVESGTGAARPAAAAGAVGRLYWNTTTGKLNIDNGGAWKHADGTSA